MKSELFSLGPGLPPLLPFLRDGPEDSSPAPWKWRKVAYGGVQPGFDDNYTGDSFLEDMVTNANVVKRDLCKVILDSVSISQYLCTVILVVLVWTYTLASTISLKSLLLLDLTMLVSGFVVFILTARMISLKLFAQFALNILYFITKLYALSPIYHTLTKSISSDSIWALTTMLIVLHLFLHDYTGCTVKDPGSLTNPTLSSNITLNMSIIASVLIASQLQPRQLVFAIVLFSLQVFLFAPFVAYCIKRYSFWLYLWFSLGVVGLTLVLVYRLQGIFFGILLGLLVFITFICPYWLTRIQKYKFEINGPWDEAKLCFDINE